MTFKLILNVTAVTGLAFGSAFIGSAVAHAQAAPADGITMDMMPITQEQLTACRSQASGQLTDEQKTLHDREHGQDKDKMAQGAVTGVSGLASTIASRRAGWWGGSNNGAGVAGATGSTQRTDRNSQAVASTTDMTQKVGTDAYQQCVNGIKGPEYIHFRQTGQMGGVASSFAPAPAAAPASAPMSPVAAPAPMPTKSPVQDEGDHKHFILTAPGQTDAREVTLVVGSKNKYIEESTGDKYIVMPDGGVTRIPGVKRVAAK